MPTIGPTQVAADGDNGYQEAGVWTAALVLMGNDAGTILNAGLRFLGFSVPQGATINDATLKITPRNLVGTITNVHGTWRAIAHDNCPQFSEGGIEPTSPTTTASLAFDPTTWSAELSYNVTPIMQELVNRPGWVGDAAAFVLLDNASVASNNVRINAFNDGPGAMIANLTVTYTAGGGGGTPPFVTTVNVRRI